MAGSSARGPERKAAVILALALVVTLSLTQVGWASAHANLLRAEPEPDSKLAQPPPELKLYFTQALARKASYVLLKTAAGSDIPVQVSFDDADPKLMRAALPALEPGAYVVKWQSLSADDDDYADGSYKLTILRQDGSAPGAAGGSSTTLLLAIGAGFALAVAAGTAVALRRRGVAS